MANARSANVWRIDTSGALPDAKNITGIKYIGAATSSATITSNASSTGTTLWAESSSSNVTDLINIADKNGVYVTITGTAVVYLYMA